MKRKMAQTSIWLMTLTVAMLAAAQAQSPATSTQTATATTDQIIARMVRAYADVRAQFRAYETRRDYEVYRGDSSEPKSDIQVNISFLPPREKSFRIERSSGGMAEHVVRKALEKEVEITKDPTISEISPINYDFELVGRGVANGHDCFILTITPKRETKDLLVGRVFVDANQFLIRRVEGHPSKSPSWWVKELELVITYDSVQGLWLQTRSEANAKVRMAGDYRVISKESDVRTAEEVSEAIAPVRVAYRPYARAKLTNAAKR
jgi:hypothetical protein